MVKRGMTLYNHLSCRSCGNKELSLILSFGKTPLANSLLSVNQLDDPEEFYDLDLFFCPNCKLVQIAQTIPPEKLFLDYPFFSSCSVTTLKRASNLANRIINTQKLNKNSLVVDVGSNDGYLLQYYQFANIPVLGIEPARNIAHYAQEMRGIKTLCSFFNLQLALQLVKEGLRADVIHLHNVLAHVNDLNGFVEGIKIVLKESGILVIEVPYVKDIFDLGQFDTIYHEHLCYFSLSSLHNLLVKHGLQIINMEHSMNQGGSILVMARRIQSYSDQRTLQRELLVEDEMGLNRIDYYARFSNRVENLRKFLHERIYEIKNQNKQIVAYGASAKGSQLLNYCAISKDIIDFVVDNIYYKQGKFMPGVHIPIYPTSKLVEVMPDYALILSWNVAEEIIHRENEFLDLGGHFIIPIPNFRIV